MGVVMKGVDGSNPLGFLAALGALSVATDAGWPATLRWESAGRWRPVLEGVPSLEVLVEAVMDELPRWRGSRVLGFQYEKNGREVRDVKGLPEQVRRWLEELAKDAALGEPQGAALASALVSDVVTDHGGSAKPSALHFTAGQQQFLAMACALAEGVGEEHVVRAVEGPWRGESKLPSLSWDATVFRDYALRAGDPSKEKRGSEPGAEWLALRGLCLVKVMPVGGRLVTTGVRGRWKSETFTWPLWSPPAGAPTVEALLRSWELSELGPARRAALGVAVVLRSAIGRSDQGGYGSFSPAQVV